MPRPSKKTTKKKAGRKKAPVFKLPPHEYTHVVSTLSQKQGWGIKQNNIPNTWQVTAGEGVTVMVIDTGAPEHDDINGNLVAEFTQIKSEGTKDLEGHSTHCCGIICAQNNDMGMVGVAPKAHVITVKALDKDGSGTNKQVADALKLAVKLKPDVVSMSLGSPAPSDEIYAEIKKLYEMNIPVVCAAGNSGARGVDYPGKYPETIAVAAYDKHGKIANFSAVGETVDFAAPGVEIYSTYLNNQYVNMNGTSMACPFFAGVIALLLSKHKKQVEEGKENDCQTVEQIKEHLLKYTVDKGYTGKDNYFGYGMVDVEKLILLEAPDYVGELPRSKVSLWKKIKNWWYSLFN